MWLKITEDCYAPACDIVGIFRPEAFAGLGDKNIRSVALLADGRAVTSPFGPKVLANRFKAGKI